MRLPSRDPATSPKVCGVDSELGNVLVGAALRTAGVGTGREASRALLRKVQGVARCGLQPVSGSGYNPQDWGRKYLPSNGGCIYIDLDHLELCIPEVLSAYDHLAAWHAMLRIARDALDAANEDLPAGQKIVVLVNSSDGQGHSYGSHLSIQLTRAAWDNIFLRKAHHMLFLASYLASSVIFTGAGKVGSENGRPPVKFQLSQRADFFEVLSGIETTFRRPLVNSRDESLGRSESTARLHVIFFDNTLCHRSSLLKVGVTQIVLAMIEQEYVSCDLLLDDPVAAVGAWSRDPSLETKARLASGGSYTALELQWSLFEKASRFVASGRATGVVPRARDILALWEDTLEKLETDVAALAPHLDWVLKKTIIERAIERNGFEWSSPKVKLLDLFYSSLDSEEGLYWIHERAGSLERLVTDARIERFVHTPPADTRAWTRAQLLRKWGRLVDDIDWDRIRFRIPGEGYWCQYRSFDMPDAQGLTRKEVGSILKDAQGLNEVLDRLEELFANSQEVVSPRVHVPDPVPERDTEKRC